MCLEMGDVQWGCSVVVGPVLGRDERRGNPRVTLSGGLFLGCSLLGWNERPMAGCDVDTGRFDEVEGAF